MRRKDTLWDHKVCPRCGIDQPRENYPIFNRRYPHSRSYCQTCFAERRRESMRVLRGRRLALGVCEYCGGDREYASMYCLRHWARCIANGLHVGTYAQADQLLTLLDAQGYRCALSGVPLVPGDNASLDHIIPLSRGGTHALSNLQWVTKAVNMAKRALSTEQFIAMCHAVVAHQAQLQCLE